MKDINVANVSTLIHFMDGLNDPRFDMAMFTHNCETPACALGWACTIPSLVEKGLDFKSLEFCDGRVGAMSRKVFGDVFLEIFANDQRIKTRSNGPHTPAPS